MALLVVLSVLLPLVCSQTLPTNYEYYTSDGISSGLSADQSYFTLNGKNITVYSGAMHYFRVPRAYWSDRLRKLRAAGLNTLETYVAWNIHEPYSGVFDFGDGGTEMEDFAHLEEYLQKAQEEDLFVIMRSGPYICSEYTFGGYPSWLLRVTPMGFRTNEANHLKYIERYYEKLLSIVEKYQFTKGGPIIAFQIENEYGYMQTDSFQPQREYLEALRQIYIKHGIVELFVTSDSPLARGDVGTIPGVLLQTANFGNDVEKQFDRLLELQPGKPVMAMEYWMGWYDFWANDHHIGDVNATINIYERILKYPANVNIYMFHGGTNFGFTNGAGLSNGDYDNSGFEPITTSYDYASPITEAGDYTVKYYAVKELLEKYNPVKTLIPEVPELTPRVVYPSITVDKQIVFDDIITLNAPVVIESENVVPMELLDINNSSGQSNGYIVYRKENVNLEPNTVLKIDGHICDTAFVLVDGVLVSPVMESSEDFEGFGYWKQKDPTLVLNSEPKMGATVDIVVEEWGRVNGPSILQYNKTFKGLWQGDVYLNDDKVSNWKIVPLEFKKAWTNNLQGWSDKTSSQGAAVYKATLEIPDEPMDTYIDMSKWSKGLVVVNGFPLGKYAAIGPQLSLYLPGPFLKTGTNDIVIFEHFRAAEEISFSLDPIWGKA